MNVQTCEYETVRHLYLSVYMMVDGTLTFHDMIVIHDGVWWLIVSHVAAPASQLYSCYSLAAVRRHRECERESCQRCMM